MDMMIGDEVETRAVRRRERAQLRLMGAKLADGAEWLADCGRVAVTPSGSVSVRGSVDGGGKAGFAGLKTCGSWSSCAVCSAKIAANRHGSLTTLIDWANRSGRDVALMTLTARHRLGQSLDDLWDGVSSGWTSITEGWGSETEAAWERRQEKLSEGWAAHWAGVPGRRRPRSRVPGDRRAAAEYPDLKEATRRVGIAEKAGYVGHVRVTEVTHGRAGWHVHYHVLMIFEHDKPERQALKLADFRGRVFSLWQLGLAKKGMDAVEVVGVIGDDGRPVRQHVGVDLRLMSAGTMADWVGSYLVKASDALSAMTAAKSLASEVILGHQKTGRQGSRTPFRLLADAIAGFNVKGLGTSEALWSEWVRVSRGRRQMTWSHGLAALAQVAAAEQADEDIAAQEAGDEDLLVLPRETWHQLRDIARRFELLEAVESGGQLAGSALLDQWGLEHQLVAIERVLLQPTPA